MLISSILPSPMSLRLLGVICVVLTITVFFSRHADISQATAPLLRRPTVEEALRTLYNPIIHPLTEPFQATDELLYQPGPPIWTRPLGKDLCIVDIDTRNMSGPNEAWSQDGNFNWTRLGGPSPGILNHYLYAQIHGYCYKFIHTTPHADRTASWARLPALASLLKSHKILVAIDADVIFPHLHLPYEWLLNHWNITHDISMGMTVEPHMDWWAGDKDSKGKQTLNDGFMTIQNIPRTFDMFRRWDNCPNDSSYAGCEGLKPNWPAEQGAFSEYIRYDFADNIREIPCTEGLGWPTMDSDCKGTLVRHYTLAKEMAREAIGDTLAQTFMGSVHREMLRQKSEVYSFRHPEDP